MNSLWSFLKLTEGVRCGFDSSDISVISVYRRAMRRLSKPIHIKLIIVAGSSRNLYVILTKEELNLQFLTLSMSCSIGNKIYQHSSGENLGFPAFDVKQIWFISSVHIGSLQINVDELKTVILRCCRSAFHYQIV